MKVKLADIRPSPYNPKQPLTKRQYAALKKNVEKYGFQRDLLVCRDFDGGGDGYICLDGHTALELLADLGRNEVDVKLVENVTDRRSLSEFITGYAIAKKPLVSEMFAELGSDFEDIFGKSTKQLDVLSRINFDAGEIDTVEEQTQYFLTLPPDCVKRLKNFVKTKSYKNDKYTAITEKIESVDDEMFLSKMFEAIL